MHLRQYMELQELSPEDLAAILDCDRSTVFRILAGRCSDAMKKRVFEKTGGQVTPNDILEVGATQLTTPRRVLGFRLPFLGGRDR